MILWDSNSDPQSENRLGSEYLREAPWSPSCFCIEISILKSLNAGSRRFIKRQKYWHPTRSITADEDKCFGWDLPSFLGHFSHFWEVLAGGNTSQEGKQRCSVQLLLQAVKLKGKKKGWTRRTRFGAAQSEFPKGRRFKAVNFDGFPFPL